jgi:hypothetical protein
MPRVMSVVVLGFSAIVLAGCDHTTDPFADCVEVTGTHDPAAPAFIVFYHSGVDAVSTTAQLEAKYAFSASTVYEALSGFAGELSAVALAGIRCEPVVRLVGHDTVVWLGTR